MERLILGPNSIHYAFTHLILVNLLSAFPYKALRLLEEEDFVFKGLVVFVWDLLSSTDWGKLGAMLQGLAPVDIFHMAYFLMRLSDRILKHMSLTLVD